MTGVLDGPEMTVDVLRFRGRVRQAAEMVVAATPTFRAELQRVGGVRSAVDVLTIGVDPVLAGSLSSGEQVLLGVLRAMDAGEQPSGDGFFRLDGTALLMVESALRIYDGARS